MLWQIQALELCPGIEPVKKEDGRYQLVVPRLPDHKVQAAIEALMPSGTKYEWKEAVKDSTAQQILKILVGAGIDKLNANSKIEGRKIEFFFYGDTPDKEDKVWGDLSMTIYDDGYYDSWSFQFRDTQVRFNRSGILGSLRVKQEREKMVRVTPITVDDVQNVQIALGTCKTVDELIAML